jgi:hypothetical protein
MGDSVREGSSLGEENTFIESEILFDKWLVVW